MAHAESECEIHLSGYSRLVKSGIQNGKLTLEQAEGILQSKRPINPLAQKSLDSKSMILDQGFRRTIPQIMNWPNTRAEIAAYLDTLKKNRAAVDSSRREQRFFVMAKPGTAIEAEETAGSLRLPDGRTVVVSSGPTHIYFWLGDQVHAVNRPQFEVRNFRPVRWPDGGLGVVYASKTADPSVARLKSDFSGWEDIDRPFPMAPGYAVHARLAVDSDSAGRSHILRTVHRTNGDLIEDIFTPGEDKPQTLRQESNKFAHPGIWVDGENLLLREGMFNFDAKLAYHIERADGLIFVLQSEATRKTIAKIPPTGPAEYESLIRGSASPISRWVRLAEGRYAVATLEVGLISIRGVFGDQTAIDIPYLGRDFLAMEWVTTAKGQQLMIAATSSRIYVFEPLALTIPLASHPFNIETTGVEGGRRMYPLVHADGTIDVIVPSFLALKQVAIRVYGDPTDK